MRDGEDWTKSAGAKRRLAQVWYEGVSDDRHDEHGDAVSSSARAVPANLLLTELPSDGEDT